LKKCHQIVTLGLVYSIHQGGADSGTSEMSKR
jgi:hypothetical protein